AASPTAPRSARTGRPQSVRRPGFFRPGGEERAARCARGSDRRTDRRRGGGQRHAPPVDPVPDVGTVYVRFAPASHVTVPPFFLMNLYSMASPAPRSMLTVQLGYVAELSSTADPVFQLPS